MPGKRFYNKFDIDTMRKIYSECFSYVEVSKILEVSHSGARAFAEREMIDTSHFTYFENRERKPISCMLCGELTHNKKFCSRDCASIYNAKAQPSRKRIYYCFYCGEKASHERKIDGVHRKICSECFTPKLMGEKEQGDLTLNKLKHLSIHQRHAKIRGYSRGIYYRSNKPKCCYNCGYNKHVEICHIKPISEFNGDIPFRIINSIDNLVALCRNCHWEFDHQLLEIKFLVDTESIL